MKFCILIPVYNEALAIKDLVKILKKQAYDIIVLDDGSQDNSGDLAKEAGAIVLYNKEKSGKGATLQRGFNYAVKEGYDGVLAMDGDGQHDPSDVENFFKYAKENPNQIITGNRMQNHQGMPIVRYLTNWFMSALISLACRQSIPDTQCGYRYIGCSILKKIQLQCTDFEIETEILMKAAKKGFPIISVPVQTIYRNEKSKINPFKDTIRFFIYFIKEIFEKNGE